MKRKINQVSLGKPKKTYRVLVRELGRKEKLRSFMIYDYSGKTNIEIIKDRLQRL